MAESEEFARISESLADAVDAVIASWVVHSIHFVASAYFGQVSSEVAVAAEEAGRQAHDDVIPRLRALLAADIDQQATTPLSLLRGAVVYPTRVLAEAGVPEVQRDRSAERLFPDDIYDLTPARLADVDPSLGELGIVWGAVKARTHMERHRPA